MNLPTREECFELLKEYHTPEHMVRHAIGVNKVAVLIAKEMNKKGYKVNVELVDRASLLHDMLRTVDLTDEQFEKLKERINAESVKFWDKLRKKYKGLRHEEATYLEFKEKYPEIAAVLRNHGYPIMAEPEKLKTWEEKILNYADKRVMHDEVVLLKQRFEEGHARNVENEDTLPIPPEEIDKNYFELEKEIFKKLDINPEDIK